MKIEEFTGEWRFLSNFYTSPLTIEGITYATVEHAFQAGKTLDTNQRLAVSKCQTAADAKRMGRSVTMRTDWNTTRVKVMTRLVGLKFRDPQLRALLLATGDMELIEGNSWNDTFWGVCRGRGENHLGKILMEVRGGNLQDAQDIPAVTTNKEGMTMQVVNKYGHTPCDKDVWIMRNNSPSNGGVALPCLGNPFGESAYAPIRVATREIAVAEYKKWLTVKVKTEKDPQIIQALRSIPEDANLVCCCAPRACHGTVVAAACRWLRQNPDFK